MPEVLPSRAKPARNFAAVALFLIVYLGVLAVVFAPRDLIAVDTGAIFAAD
jgi:hypothetical protein